MVRFGNLEKVTEGEISVINKENIMEEKREGIRQVRIFPGGSDGKEYACNAGDPGSIPRWRRSPGEGNGNPLQYSCLENFMDRGAWQATVHGVAKSWT